MKEILLIGNGPCHSANPEELAVYSQLVVRFNRCRSMPTGARIDALSLVDGTEVKDEILTEVKRVWIPHIWIGESDPRNQWLSGRLKHFPMDEIRFLYPKMPAGYKGRGMSSGFSVLLHVLASPEFEGWRVATAGFTWEGSDWHDWRTERAVCQDYINAGRVIHYP